jgi:hypothetical protein
MHSRTSWIAIVVVLAACRIEGGSPPGQPVGGSDRPPGGGFGFESHRDTASPADRQVFNRTPEQVVPGVNRLTIGAFVRGDQGRDAVRTAMQALVDEARRRDSTLAAVRVLAYFPPSPGAPRGAFLSPLGYLDWVPPGGWDSLSATSAQELHRYNMVLLADIPAHRPPRQN